MAQPSDLMGLGLPPLLAEHIAETGNGSLTATAAGSTFATSTKILPNQNMLACSNANGTVALGLPAVGGDAGALLGDPFVISNTGTTSLQVFASSGITINMNGSNTSQQPVQAGTTSMIWPISTTQWIGVKGA